jgi:molybdopterin-guanine dinucleotide biosynthesis protein B
VAARRRRRLTPIVAFSGPSGVGKTRLLRRLVAELSRRGLGVGFVKHTGHDHPLDRRGKDTEVLRRAGALAAAIEGPAGMAFFGPARGGARALAELMPAADLILAEGWRREPLPRVEVHRRSVSPEFLCARDRRVLAVVTDEPPPRPLPTFDADEVAAIADLLCARFRLEGRNMPEPGEKGPALRFRRSPEPGAAAERRPRRGRATRSRARRRQGKTVPGRRC